MNGTDNLNMPQDHYGLLNVYGKIFDFGCLNIECIKTERFSDWLPKILNNAQNCRTAPRYDSNTYTHIHTE